MACMMAGSEPGSMAGLTCLRQSSCAFTGFGARAAQGMVRAIRRAGVGGGIGHGPSGAGTDDNGDDGDGGPDDIRLWGASMAQQRNVPATARGRQRDFYLGHSGGHLGPGRDLQGRTGWSQEAPQGWATRLHLALSLVDS